MRQESKDWMIQAEADLKTAGDCLKDGNFYACALFCQQTAEKALKALYIEQNNHLAPKTHNLLKLSLDLKLPKELEDCSRLLAPAYMSSRYPDAGQGVPAKFYIENNTKPLIGAAKEEFEWVKKKMGI